ncbi:molybdenum cofactor biosynthesis protein MoaA [Ignicoccus pacificus DSM 13166]|uniref:Molybdenum cofactor biosynthesis protein MoaA n=1 Tax=Ignicoccus pacificus DSM 13166 TaxID=940294 RepID=A0A977K947_9CREN|nr:molybdenum cofactor biosynthesis protein MoaA [Ignicoccus pacificus DSM 13166]
MFDPISLGEKVAERVCSGIKRKYYRFRGGRFYGGCSTADVVGCNLRCVFCWSAGSRKLDIGDFYSPKDVANRLVRIAERAGYSYARISGGEPTLCKNHLLEVIKRVTQRNIIFILETNGILIGYDEELARDIAEMDKVYVRVSIKGPNEKWFSRLTGAEPRFFEYQLKALENLIAFGKDPSWLRAAVVMGYGSEEEYAELLERLASIHPSLANIEPEVLTLYPKIKRRLERADLLPKVYYEAP